MELYERAREYMESRGIEALIKKSSAVLVAFSGGADSAVLLRILKRYLGPRGIPLAAAHLDHMIRGSEAKRDQQFCREWAERLNIPFFTKSENVPLYAEEKGMSIEEAARELRYRFLWDTAASLGENILIATAHNATDNLETVLFNLARGTGTKGIGGISPIRDGRIIRPLLFATGEEIRDWAGEQGVDFVFDSTNSDTAYTRNYVRKNIVPLIRELNPRAEESVLRLGAIARSEAEYIESEALRLIKNRMIPRAALDGAHEALVRAAIRLLYKQHTGSLNGLSMKSLCLAEEFCRFGRGAHSLPGATLFSDADGAFFKREEETLPAKTVLRLNAPAVAFGDMFACAVTELGAEPVYDKNIYNLFIQQSTCFDTIYDSIFVRPRENGDRILINGMHKRLKKLMCDKNVPLRYRDRLPLFCDGGGILWVPTVGLRDNAAKNNITLHVFIKASSV